MNKNQQGPAAIEYQNANMARPSSFLAQGKATVEVSKSQYFTSSKSQLYQTVTSAFHPRPAVCQNLAGFSVAKLKEFLDSFDTVMTDCDGVLWIGNEAIPGSPEALNFFRKIGKRVFYCTNNSTKTRAEYAVKVRQLGFGGDKSEIIGTAYLAAKYLKNINYDGKVYVIGSTGITQELAEVGIESTGVGEDCIPSNWSLSQADDILDDLGPEYKCVIVGYDSKINYLKLAKASSLLCRPDMLYIGTNPDENLPYKGKKYQIKLPSTMTILNAISTSSGREPVIMGKPHPAMFEAVRKVHPRICPRRTLMIGDRANTDVLLGKNCNLQTLMVGTGIHTLSDVRRWEQDEGTHNYVADFYVDRLGDIVQMAQRAGIV